MADPRNGFIPVRLPRSAANYSSGAGSGARVVYDDGSIECGYRILVDTASGTKQSCVLFESVREARAQWETLPLDWEQAK